MENYLFKILILLSILGCEKKSEKVVSRENCIPEIEIERNKDTLRVGEKYIAKVQLSDDSYYYINENGTKTTILPIFRINGELVESENTYYIYEETVKDQPNNDETKPIIREWSSGIIFPHPNWGEVEISSRNSYVIMP